MGIEMSNRAIRTLMLGCLAIPLAWGLSQVLPVGDDAVPLEDAFAVERILGAADPDVVVAVYLPGGNGRSVRLARDGERWTVNGQLADSASVGRFWQELSELRVVEVVERAWEGHARLGVDRAAALPVVFERAGAADTLLIGRSGPAGKGFFARLPGHDVVYRIEPDLRAAVLRAPEAWRSRRIVRLDTTLVASLQVEQEGGGYTLVRSDAGWSIGDDSVGVKFSTLLLGALASVEASGFPEEPDAEQDRAPERALVVRNARSDVLVTLEFWRSGGEWVVRRGDDATEYTVPAALVERLTPALPGP